MQAGSRCLKAQGLTDVEAKQLAKELATDRSLLVLDLSVSGSVVFDCASVCQTQAPKRTHT